MIYRTVVRVWKWNVADWIFINLLINVYLLFINSDKRGVTHSLNIKTGKNDFIELWDFELLAQASNSVVLLESRREGKDLVLPRKPFSVLATWIPVSLFRGQEKEDFAWCSTINTLNMNHLQTLEMHWGCHAEKCHCVLCLEILHEINVPEAFPVLLHSVCELQFWGAMLESLLSWFWKAEQFFGVHQDTLNLKMLKIHSAN